MESEEFYADRERVYVRLVDSPLEVHTGRLIAVTEVMLVIHADGAAENLLTYYPLRSVRQFDLEIELDDDD